MKAVKSTDLPQDVSVMQSVDFSQAYANVLSLTCRLARMGAEEPNLSMAQLVKILDSSNLSRADWMDTAFEQPSEKDGSASDVSIADVILASEYGTSKAAQALNHIIKRSLAALLSDPIVRDDFGMCLFRDLTSTPDTRLGWGAGIMPATGYPKRFITANAVLFRGAESVFQLYHPADPTVKAVALTLMRLDLSRVKFAMFKPSIDSNESIERKDKMFGEVGALKHLLKRLWAFSAAYRHMAIRLLDGVNRRLQMLQKQKYLERSNVASDAIMLEESARSEFENTPEHPLGKYLASCFSTGTIATAYGVHDTIYIDSSTAWQDWAKQERNIGDPCGASGVQTLSLSYERYLRTIVSSRGDIDSCLARGWDSVNKMTDAAEKKKLIDDGLTVPAYMARLKGVPGLLDDIKAIFNELGHGSVTGNLGELDAIGADFAYTNGISCNRPVDQVALGLTPCLSLANQRARGLSVRFDPAFFSTGPAPLSLVPISGRNDINRSGDYLERAAMPWGMMITEPNTGAVNQLSVDLAPTARAAVDHYVPLISVYPSVGYRDIVPADTATMVFTTSWDTMGMTSKKVGGNPQDKESLMKSEWSTALQSSGAGTLIEETAFVVRLDGLPFYGRELVEVTRQDSYDIFNEEGRYLLGQNYSHIVIFDNTFELLHDFKELDKYLTWAPPVLAIESTTKNSDDVARAVSADANALGT